MEFDRKPHDLDLIAKLDTEPLLAMENKAGEVVSVEQEVRDASAADTAYLRWLADMREEITSKEEGTQQEGMVPDFQADSTLDPAAVDAPDPTVVDAPPPATTANELVAVDQSPSSAGDFDLDLLLAKRRADEETPDDGEPPPAGGDDGKPKKPAASRPPSRPPNRE